MTRRTRDCIELTFCIEIPDWSVPIRHLVPEDAPGCFAHVREARVGKVIGRYKMAKHYTLAITDSIFTFHRNQAAIDTEAALDGLYVIATSVPATQMTVAKVVATYTALARVERDFRSLESIELDLRPIHRYTETRVRGHVFLCTLAAYLVWHLRQAWAHLTFTDTERPEPTDPVAPARRSAAADRKAASKTTTDELPARSFASLLDHLATLTRNEIRFVAIEDQPVIEQLALPAPPNAARSNSSADPSH